MNQSLRTLLQSVFNLAESEFNETLSKADISSWDSLGHMDLVTRLEREFNITLTMQDIIAMQSFPTIIDILKEKGVIVEG
ncbi:MAG: acyl carrier protein [Gammaproteobacteria bacterium]|nr:acyl carrier protein [Gammaproteobacteria bacterium]